MDQFAHFLASTPTASRSLNIIYELARILILIYTRCFQLPEIFRFELLHKLAIRFDDVISTASLHHNEATGAQKPCYCCRIIKYPSENLISLVHDAVWVGVSDLYLQGILQCSNQVRKCFMIRARYYIIVDPLISIVKQGPGASHSPLKMLPCRVLYVEFLFIENEGN